MGLFDFIRTQTPASSSAPAPSLQQEANQQMLKMMQDRLAVSTCPTERQQLQNAINAMQKSQSPIPAPTPIQGPPQAPKIPSFELQMIEQELNSIKMSMKRIEELVQKLKAQ